MFYTNNLIDEYVRFIEMTAEIPSHLKTYVNMQLWHRSSSQINGMQLKDVLSHPLLIFFSTAC